MRVQIVLRCEEDKPRISWNLLHALSSRHPSVAQSFRVHDEYREAPPSPHSLLSWLSVLEILEHDCYRQPHSILFNQQLNWD